MNTCVDCGSRFDSALFGNSPAACPHCGKSMAEDSSEKWQDAARVASLAEAGYLVNLLGTIGVSARIYDARSFSALHGAWDQSYVIQVPPDQVGDAAGLLKREANAANDEGDEFGIPSHSGGVDTLVFWRPVALMAIAGVASFVVGQRFAQPSVDGRDRPYAQSLVAAMEQVGRPLVTEPRGEGVRYRFVFHPQRRTWYVQVDRDGDGRFDFSRDIRAVVVER